MEVKMKAILIVLDSLGAGELPDADKYGDKGADTFGHIYEKCPEIKIPNLRKMGYCNIEGMPGDLAEKEPAAAYARLAEVSAGKDTITGHWEIAGIKTDVPFKTYPDGFPAEFIEAFEKQTGRKVLGNYPRSGTVIIEELGAEHEATGKPIVYTSADSVFQIAANIDVIPLEELYSMCEKARALLRGEWACGRVIARPYRIIDGKRERTPDRKDYAVSPPEETLLDKLAAAGRDVYAVGKIHDIFNGQGITQWVHTDNNMDGVDKTLDAMDMDPDGLIFTNLVDFDSKYGHRRDPEGYAKAIEEFDERLPELMAKMGKDDVLMLCADHGNDPTHTGFDHTREYIPLLVYGEKIIPADMGTRDCFGDIGASIAEMFGAGPTAVGTSFMALCSK